MALAPQFQAGPDVSGLEIKDLANVDKRKIPFSIVREKPLMNLSKQPGASPRLLSGKLLILANGFPQDSFNQAVFTHQFLLP
jgi:hypothetical protein